MTDRDPRGMQRERTRVIPVWPRRNAAQHGTRAKYNEGCACDPCCFADRSYQARRRATR